MFNKNSFDRAVTIKGYGSYKRTTSESKIQEIKSVPGDSPLKVKPTIIKCLKDYIDFVNGLETTFKNPVFYRGQTNADYLLTPNCLRVNPKNEHLMIEAFSRRFYDELKKCQYSMEQLMLMQHYLLPTRCLDVSESPLMALYFACSHMKKFRTKIVPPEEEDWGEITLFRDPDDYDQEKPEQLKSIESSNISIIANANMAYIEGREDESKELTKEILKKGYVTYRQLNEHGWGKKGSTGDLRFKKITPYSVNSEIPIFETDPFDLKRLIYKKDGVQQVVLIPPDKKQSILDELKKLYITEDFVYPDMDNVANEINEQINK